MSLREKLNWWPAASVLTTTAIGTFSAPYWGAQYLINKLELENSMMQVFTYAGSAVVGAGAGLFAGLAALRVYQEIGLPYPTGERKKLRHQTQEKPREGKSRLTVLTEGDTK